MESVVRGLFPNEEFVAHWAQVIEVPYGEGASFRILTEGSHQTSTKHFTSLSGESRMAQKVESRVTVVAADGMPEGSVANWLEDPDRRKTTVVLRAVKSTAGAPQAKSATEPFSGERIPVRVGAFADHVPIEYHGAEFRLGPFPVPGVVVGKVDEIMVEIIFHNKDLPELPLSLDVVEIAPYVAGRGQLLETWQD